MKRGRKYTSTMIVSFPYVSLRKRLVSTGPYLRRKRMRESVAFWSNPTFPV